MCLFTGQIDIKIICWINKYINTLMTKILHSLSTYNYFSLRFIYNIDIGPFLNITDLTTFGIYIQNKSSRNVEGICVFQ